MGVGRCPWTRSTCNHKWLGIPPAEQPPNHYRLLGISAYENDPEVIDRAADGRMIFLRQNQSGPNGHWSQLLLNEVSAGRICLLDESTKQNYDAGLREHLNPDLTPLGTGALPMLPGGLAILAARARPARA